MDIVAFQASLKQATPPPGLSLALEALWHDGKVDWDTAHQRAQDEENRDGSWVHAYLHRKEGDQGNAAYWYRRADKPVASGSLEEEWEDIATALLRGA